MKKFKFTLQPVHNLREAKLEQEQLRLASLQEALAKAFDSLEKAERERLDATDEYARKIQAGELPSLDFSLMMNYLKTLAHREKEARKNLDDAKHACAQQINRLTEAMRDVEATGKLRERQQARHDLELARAEQNTLDEMVSISYARQAAQMQ